MQVAIARQQGTPTEIKIGNSIDGWKLLYLSGLLSTVLYLSGLLSTVLSGAE